MLLLWSLIVLSGASFVLSDWTCWCSVLAKPLVSLVLLLWSLIALFFLQSAHGDKDRRNWQILPWTSCLPKVFFGTYPGAPFGFFLVPLLVFRLWFPLVFSFNLRFCINQHSKLCPIYRQDFRVFVLRLKILHDRTYHVTDRNISYNHIHAAHGPYHC